MNIHKYPGDIFYASREFTDDEVRDLLRFPCWVIIKSGDNIIKHIGYNKDGEKSFVKYGSGSNITKTSQLINDGEYGSDKFSTVSQVLKKLDRPEWSGVEAQFFVVSSPSSVNLRPMTISPNQVPYWAGNTFFNSPIYVNGSFVGVGKSDPTERLDVNGNVRADNYRYNVTTANTVPLKDWTDGLLRYFTDKDGVNKKIAIDVNGVNVNQIIITTTASITTATKDSNGISQNGKNVFINNGSSNINLTINTNAEDNFCATYIKNGTGIISVIAGFGVQLDLVSNTDLVNGKSGSRLMISRDGNSNNFKVFIRNYE